MDWVDTFFKIVAVLAVIFFASVVLWFGAFVVEEAFAYPYNYYSNYYSYFNYYDYYYYEDLYRYYDYVTPVWMEHYTPYWHYETPTYDFIKEQNKYVYSNYGWNFYP